MAAIAEELAKAQKEISVAEFFERNRQILGFDSLTKALITSVKEAVDNALDACEEAGILPDIRVEVRPTEHKDEFALVVEDNGPGITQASMPKVFGQLLYGSRFHAIRQSRGQQGIGISAVVLYGQLTTGHRATAASKVGKGRPCVQMELAIDTKRNQPEVYDKQPIDWDRDHGTRIKVTMKARYQGGQKSVYEYLRSTSIVNPHARITFIEPGGETHVFDRTDDEVPEPTKAIKPHPLGTELGTILKMARHSKYRKLSSFLQKEFVSVGAGAAKKIIEEAGMTNSDPKDLTRQEARRLHEAFQKVRIMSPPTDCLSPIGEGLVRRGLKKETEDISPEYITTVTRPPSVWGGHPFQVEVGVVYGGTLPKEQSVRILRFANRVPLLYQGGSCECTLAVQDVDWRRYGLEQRGGKGTPVGPAIILVHIASTKVPFTSEAKEAVAPMEEIHKDIRLALQEAARGLGRHLKKAAKRAKVSQKFDLVQKVLPELARKSAHMLGKPEPDLAPIVCKIMDVVWVEDASVEYEKLQGQFLAHKVQAVVSSTGDAGDAPDGDPAGAAEADGTDASSEATEAAPAARARSGTLDDYGDEPGAPVQLEKPKQKQAYLARAKVAITNYKQKGQKFRLYAVVPDGSVFVEADPEPKKVDDRYVMWEVPVLKPAQKMELSVAVGGVEKGALDGMETFVSGINEINVVGADPWHGGEE